MGATPTVRIERATRLWRHSGSASLALLAAAAAFVAWYFLALDTDAQNLAYQVPGMVAPVAILAGTLIHRPEDRRPWIILAVGQTLTVLGDWTWVLLERMGIEPFPSVADTLYLSGTALTALAIILLVRGRIPGGDRAGLIDALVVAVGAGLLSWTFLMAPLVADPEASVVSIAVALAYPILDILLLGIMVRLFLAPGRRVPALQLLLFALVALLAADFPYAVMALEDGYATGNVVEIGWLAAPFLFAAAALHPSMSHVADPAEVHEAQLSPIRLAMLAAASLMAPAVLVIQGITGEHVDIPVVATGCVVLFLLVIARLGGLVSDLRTTLHERQTLERELEHRALHDPLTGLPNRSLFYDRLDHALARRAGQVAVLFLDLDDFKTVNDTFGHQEGDNLLRRVADAIRKSARASDTVARLGGDEFALLADGDVDVATATLIAQRLLEAISTPKPIGGKDRSVGASIGISVGRAGESAAERLMREADVAMYVAKSKGKSGYSVFDPRTHERVVRTMGLQTDLERGIRDHQLELHYQPIVSLESGEIAGIEALVRWRHPTRGLLLPGDFIHIAELTGAVVALDRWVLDEAGRQAAAWGAGGPTGDGRFLSVNLSPLALVQPGLVDAVRAILARSRLRPEQLMLEVTETVEPDPAAVAETLAALKGLGVRLAIDDFGTGFASLSRLLDSPFDVIKIDESLLQAMSHDPRAGAIVSGILDLARRLGSTTIAEGLETADQLTELRQLGCHYGQGFHFAPALPAAELEAQLVVDALETPSPAWGAVGARRTQPG
jgi:diguanylate cyclase (GGDEF)-like protein